MVDGSDSTVHSTSFARGLSSRLKDASPFATLTVLAHPDPNRVGDRAVLGDATTDVAIPIDRQRPELVAPGRPVGRPLGDRHISRRSVLLIPAADGSFAVDASHTSTALRLDGRSVTDHHTIRAEALDHGVVVELAHRVVLLLHRHRPPAEPCAPSFGLVGESTAMVAVRNDLQRVADLDVGVLIRGETGTGKELVARALHDHSARANQPFVAVNLGAVTPSLAISELFGVHRGAFTGADQARDGCFAQADDGTLLLDEIGEAPTEVQVALLRALETGLIQPVGAPGTRPVNVRVLAATDADLETQIADGAFRAPLLHRLAAYEIHLPPLRHRRDDIGRLLVHFLRQDEAKLGDHRLARQDGEPWIDPDLMTRLVHFSWPGNVRQLRNVVQHLAIGNRGQPCLRSTPTVDRWLAEAGDLAPAASTTTSPVATPPPRRLPSMIDDDEIVATLRGHRFEVKAAAEALGISRAALYAWIEDNPRVRTAGQLDADLIRRAHAELGGDLEALVERLEVSRFALRRRLRELGL